MVLLAIASLLAGIHPLPDWPVPCLTRVDFDTLIAEGEPALRADLHDPFFTPHVPARLDSGIQDQESFEYSDGYSTRLTIHRIASYATLPLFAAQVITGEVLLRDRESPPGWAKSVHGPIAAGLAGLFLVNTVTGGMNALEARNDPYADTRGTVHTLLMLLADAGFVFTGLTVESAGTVGPHGRTRTKHRKAALISMGFATAGYVIMLPPFRKD